MYHEHKTKNINQAGVIVMTVSLSAHISDESRDKLELYKELHEFKNLSDTVEDILTKMPKPEPKKKRAEPDPNQTTLTEHES